MKKFFQELKDFALKGNVMDMAVGVIIGASFQGIVTSLTNDILNPILGIAFSTDFSNVVIPLFGDNCIYVGSFLSVNCKSEGNVLGVEKEPKGDAHFCK